MKYIGEFYSINSVLYKIEITTKKSGSDAVLKLSGQPFVSSIESEDKHIYSPIKCGGATVGVLTDSFNTDFYSGEAQGVKVTLYNETESNRVEWVGYVAPTAYDQNFDEYYEEIQLDCVDGIAVLKSLPFSVNAVKQIDTFSGIIFKCLKKSNCYSAFYVSDNVQLTANGTESVIDKLRISQANFFDDKDSADQTDDDVAWSCYDVLHEVLQYLGYVLFVNGDEVIIADYDAIKSGNNRYFKYSLAGSAVGTPTATTFSYKYNIDETSYSENGTSLSLDEVYNKVTVKDEFKTYEELFPMFGDPSTERNITGILDDGSGFNDCVLYSDIITDQDRFGDFNNHQVMLVHSSMYKKNKYRNWLMVWKFMESDVLEFKRYNSLRNEVNVPAVCYSSVLLYNGASYIKYWQKELTNDEDKIVREQLKSLGTDRGKRRDYWLSILPFEINWKSMIIGYNGDNGHIGPGAYQENGNYNNGPNQSNWKDYRTIWNQKHAGDGIKFDENHCYRLILSENEDALKYPFIKLKSQVDASIFGGMDAYLLINGSFIYHDEWKTPFPMAGTKDNDNLNRKKDFKMPEEGYIWCMLKWGNKWWDGSEWKNSKCNFKLFFWDSTWSGEDSEKRYTNKKIFDETFKFQNNASKFLEGEEGYYIPVPKDENLEGSVDFIIYANRDMKGCSPNREWSAKGTYDDNFYSRYKTKVMIIQDLSLTAKVANGRFNDAGNDSDTVYTNIIDNGSVNEMGEITFKVCTYDYKAPSYSSVTCLNGTKSQFVKGLYNKALASEERSSIGSDGSTPDFRQEEHFIYKLAKQYTEPKVIFKVNLKNMNHKLYGLYTDKTLSGKTFIVTENETDYRMNRQTLTLIEKA